jgi:hypothetical protein
MNDHTATTHAPAYLTATDLAAQAPLGSLVRYTDFAAEPPARFKNKHAVWKSRNNSGRLISVTPPDAGRTGSLTLHEGDYGAHGVVVVSFRKTFTLDTQLRFAVIAPPAPGSFAVLTRYRNTIELQHLAATEADALAWLERNPHGGATVEMVSAPARHADLEAASTTPAQQEI